MTRTAWRFARSRTPPLTWPLLAVAATTVVLTTPLHYTLPWAGGGWKPQLFAPLAPVLFVMFSGFSTTNWMSVLETGSARMPWARLGWATLLVMLSTGVAAFAGLVNAPEWAVVMARNSAAFAGLMLLSAALLGARLAWMPPLTVLVALLLGGRNLETAETLAWALPLAPADSIPALGCSTILVLAGAIAYARWDSCPSRGIVGE